MFRNYLTVALRNLRKNKIFSFINILGLALGISATLVIYLIIHHEFSYDKYQKGGDRIYRVVSVMHFPDQEFKLSGVSVPLVPAVTNRVTGIELAVPFVRYGPSTITIPATNEVYKKQPEMLFADENYFNLIPFKWLVGNPSLLREPFKVVLSESRAKLYFGSVANAVGKTIAYNDSVKTTVAGVVSDLKEITDFRFSEFISLTTIPATNLKYNFSWDQWPSINSSSQFFIKLAPGVSASSIEKQITAIRDRNTKSDYMKISHFLQPLSDLHFSPEYDNFNQAKASRPTLYGLLLVAGFLLLLGCINFINLTTAQAAQRAREIGIRKTIGGSRKQLILQFLGETFFLTVLACGLSLLMIPWLLNLFADFIPPDIHFRQMADPHMLLFMALLTVVVSIASGFYPSLVLSGYKPVLVMKNQAYAGTGKTRKAWLRRSLTISQFVIAQFFIIVTLIVGHQIKYTMTKDMGFRKEAMLTLSRPFNYRNPAPEKAQTLLNRLRQIPGIEGAVLAGTPPASMGASFGTIKYTGEKGEVETSAEIKNADSAYFNLYKMKLLAGRYPVRDSMIGREVLINNNYARFLGFTNPADAVGKVLDRGQTKVTVTGVLADFNFRSLHWSILPLIYTDIDANNYTFHVALQPATGKNDWPKTISKIESAYKEIYPEAEFEYNWLDQSIAAFYQTERNTSRLLSWATGLCIFISCLGLLGLVIYTTNHRAKEIGVRKVLGASVASIVSLLSRDFLQLVFLAFIIASPLAWWAGYTWLQDFEYREGISWTIFLLSGTGMIGIALLTLSLQVIRSAMMNPVKSLKTE